MIKQNEVKRGKKNPTTNYPKDSHKAFCERCFRHNNGCPDTRSQRKNGACAL
jgi:hypothetical protein